MRTRTFGSKSFARFARCARWIENASDGAKANGRARGGRCRWARGRGGGPPPAALDAHAYVRIEIVRAVRQMRTMDRERFRRREAAFGIHREHVVEQRHRLVGDAGEEFVPLTAA